MLSQTRANKFSLDIAKISGIQSIEDHDAESFNGGFFEYEKIMSDGATYATGFTPSSSLYLDTNGGRNGFIETITVTNLEKTQQTFSIAYGQQNGTIETSSLKLAPGGSLAVGVEDADNIAIGHAGDTTTANARAKAAYRKKEVISIPVPFDTSTIPI